ncbi:LLM class flavin-dependent oxidoreductase [Pseudonocardia benzenivorans]
MPATPVVNKLRFGIFMPPFNSPPTQNATTSLQRDVETIQLLDRLGYDEAWIGEHHSAGTEIIADPLTFIAHVGALTRHIKLGTGVVSLPYHHPLWIADRAILVDHLLRGRLMLGVGPGSLPTDAAMVGLEPAQLRPALGRTSTSCSGCCAPTSASPTAPTGTRSSRHARSSPRTPTRASRSRWPRRPRPPARSSPGRTA